MYYVLSKALLNSGKKNSNEWAKYERVCVIIKLNKVMHNNFREKKNLN